jgi:transcriptional regulator GlxA family with amidase domain
LDPLIKNRKIEVHLIRPGHRTSDRLLTNLRKLKELQEQPDAEFATRNLLSESWLLLLEDIQGQQPGDTAVKTESQDRLRSMIAYIHGHYQEKLTLAQIAGCAAVSEREALRCFRRHLQQTPVAYLTGFRLNQAKKLLAETELSVTEISFRCGFSDSAYMGKVFRKAFELTPQGYRKLRKQSL